ncbi:hypothetical protein MUP35_04280 [Patescibacteria group bacterium]|nr:hypothetical protein [Patescibacteria group bacterium]
MKKKKKLSLKLIAFLQALGLVFYCGLVSLLFWQGENLFGRYPSFLAPLLMLVLFSTSALIVALLTLGYPIVLFWKKKQTMQALRLVGYTAGWLITFIAIIILIVLLIKNYF